MTTTTTTTTTTNNTTTTTNTISNNMVDDIAYTTTTNTTMTTTKTTTTTTTTNTNNNKNAEKKLIDSSNLSTTTTTIPTTKLDTDWECVQAKLKYLKMKTKQCNDYTSKLNRLTNYKQQQHSIKSFNNIKNKTNEQDIEAIAALSSSLQESVAAAVINVNVNNNNNNANADLITEATASRCIPYEINSHKTKSHSRLFNLNRNDLIRLDEDVIRSLYFTLKYFNNNYFKTVCTCGDLLTTVVNKTNSNNQDYSLSDLLSMKKTCIFCHLLKEYEKNSINAIINNHTNNNSELLLKQNNNNNNDDRLADLNIVRTDHSYCKQFNNNNNNKRTTVTTTTNNNNNNIIKLSKQVSSEQNDLLERLVNDRLCRIFDENNNNNNIFEKLIINSNDDEQFIDAGLDLSPNDLKNLPDLSYEE